MTPHCLSFLIFFFGRGPARAEQAQSRAGEERERPDELLVRDHGDIILLNCNKLMGKLKDLICGMSSHKTKDKHGTTFKLNWFYIAITASKSWPDRLTKESNTDTFTKDKSSCRNLWSNPKILEPVIWRFSYGHHHAPIKVRLLLDL